MWTSQHPKVPRSKVSKHMRLALLRTGLWFRLRMQQAETSFFLKGHLRHLAVLSLQMILYYSADTEGRIRLIRRGICPGMTARHAGPAVAGGLECFSTRLTHCLTVVIKHACTTSTPTLRARIQPAAQLLGPPALTATAGSTGHCSLRTLRGPGTIQCLVQAQNERPLCHRSLLS